MEVIERDGKKWRKVHLRPSPEVHAPNRIKSHITSGRRVAGVNIRPRGKTLAELEGDYE